MALVILPPYIPSTVLFTNGSAAPIAGANSPCFPSKMVMFRSAKNGSSVTFCRRNSRSASVKYGTRKPLRITSLSMTVLTFRIAAARLERYSSQIMGYSVSDPQCPVRCAVIVFHIESCCDPEKESPEWQFQHRRSYPDWILHDWRTA